MYIVYIMIIRLFKLFLQVDSNKLVQQKLVPKTDRQLNAQKYSLSLTFTSARKSTFLNE